MRGAITFALFVVGLSAQPPKPGRVEGTITNSVTGAAVKKAEVSMQGQKTAHLATVTDSAGHFVFESVAPGEYFTQLSCPGFTAPLGLSGTKRIVVAAGDDVRGVSLQMMPFAVIAGRILDEDGDPMMNATVFPLHYIYRDGRRQMGGTQSSMTNDLGEFRIIDVPPGRYYLRATGPRGGAYPDTYYPGGIEFAQAAALEVKAGAEVSGIEFHLKKVPSYHVRGKLINAQTGKPATNAMILFGQMIGVGPEGDFDIPAMTVGTHDIRAVIAATNGAGHETVIVTDHDLDNVRITVQPAVKITGSVIMEGTPAPIQRGAVRVALESQTSTGGIRSLSTIVNDNGTFEFREAPPELYTVRLTGNLTGKYLKAIQFAGRETADGIFDLRQGLSGEILLTLGADGGQLRGTTTPQVWVTAALVSATLRPDQFHITGSDAQGNFRFQDLAPGTYKVMAWGGGDASPPKIAELRALLDNKAATVSVTSGGMESVQVSMISADEIAEALQKLP